MCDRLAAGAVDTVNYLVDMGRKLGGVRLWGAGSLSNTMWPGPLPTSLPSSIVIHPTVCPQYTNVTDREDTARTDRTGNRRRSDSIDRTVSQMVTQKLQIRT